MSRRRTYRRIGYSAHLGEEPTRLVQKDRLAPLPVRLGFGAARRAREPRPPYRLRYAAGDGSGGITATRSSSDRCCDAVMRVLGKGSARGMPGSLHAAAAIGNPGGPEPRIRYARREPPFRSSGSEPHRLSELFGTPADPLSVRAIGVRYRRPNIHRPGEIARTARQNRAERRKVERRTVKPALPCLRTAAPHFGCCSPPRLRSPRPLIDGANAASAASFRSHGLRAEFARRSTRWRAFPPPAAPARPLARWRAGAVPADRVDPAGRDARPRCTPPIRRQPGGPPGPPQAPATEAPPSSIVPPAGPASPARSSTPAPAVARCHGLRPAHGPTRAPPALQQDWDRSERDQQQNENEKQATTLHSGTSPLSPSLVKETSKLRKPRTAAPGSALEPVTDPRRTPEVRGAVLGALPMARKPAPPRTPPTG